jgi:1-acyl-sn-glycerol-3-phosphate acyltransferase
MKFSGDEMIRTVLFYMRFVAIMAFSIFRQRRYIRRKKHMDLDEYTKMVFKWTSNFASRLVAAMPIDVEVLGLENVPQNETIVFISNHQSYLDVPLLLSRLPVYAGYIAKDIMLKTKIPGLGGWTREMRCVFLEDNNPKQAARVALETIEILKSGHSMVIFPEGERSKSKEMLEFKKGAFSIAYKSKLKIVPITIDGAYRLLEDVNFRLTKGKIRIVIHEPIETEGLTKSELDALPKRIFEIIASELTI